MRILRNARVNSLCHQYEKGGAIFCPDCAAPLKVMTVPRFGTSGRMTCSTFSVVCKNCGVSGAVETPLAKSA